MGISLSSLSGNQVNEPEATVQEKEITGSRRLSEEELIAAWNEYAATLTEEKLLKNTMTLYLPRLIGDELFEVEVNTELNRQYLTDNSLSIISYLREKLDNGGITMSIRIAEGNAIRKALTSREIFDEMTKQNPSLQKLSDEFGLELS
jgi:DNA polymerase-3 subunit gamma/tau